jgi:nucleotide-binding universal stress UspA family protein
MKTILVPTDFSDAAHNALLYTVELAKTIQGKILLYHAYHIPLPQTEGMPMIIEDATEFEKDNIVRIKKEISLLTKTDGVPIDYLTTEGLAVKEIIALEKSKELYLIIMGMKTREVLNEFVFGSVVTDVIRKTATPVIIVPEHFKFKKIEKIVFASDHTAEINIPTAFKDIMENFHSKIFILHIVKEKGIIETNHGVAGLRIEKYFENIEHIYDFLMDNNLIRGIAEFIDINKIDMLAMIQHKHKLLERIFKESQTKKMAFHTNVPLLILPTLDITE